MALSMAPNHPRPDEYTPRGAARIASLEASRSRAPGSPRPQGEDAVQRPRAATQQPDLDAGVVEDGDHGEGVAAGVDGGDEREVDPRRRALEGEAGQHVGLGAL